MNRIRRSAAWVDGIKRSFLPEHEEMLLGILSEKSRNFTGGPQNICVFGANAMGAARETSFCREAERTQRSRQKRKCFAASPDEKGEGETLCLRSLTASTFLRPARLWTSSRWKLPATCVYPLHLKRLPINTTKNLLKSTRWPTKAPHLSKKLRCGVFHFNGHNS